jgi:hypothetical protein
LCLRVCDCSYSMMNCSENHPFGNNKFSKDGQFIDLIIL